MHAPLLTAQADKQPEKAYLVGIEFPGSDPVEANNLLSELRELTLSLELEVCGSELVHLREPHSHLLLGTGKADEIIRRAKNARANILIFDHELSPAQQRNWEKRSGLIVIDREEVILDIFAKRARTREARLQIGLAQMEYSLPRLTRAWSHLSRQRGAANLRGEGESQLEVDRRIIRKRIDKFRAELRHVREVRATQRKQRLRLPTPSAAIVGYTNAGKSSLLRALTKADVLVEDKLFATLDPTTRRITFPDHSTLLITDTVGFVRKLPHRLIEAFKATLEEAVMSTFLIHVVDASSAEAMSHLETTLGVLRELGADQKNILTVFNKMDLVADTSQLAHLRHQFPQALFVSVQTGSGLDELLHRLQEMARPDTVHLTLRLPHTRYDLVAQMHKLGHVFSEHFTEHGIEAEARLPLRHAAAFQQFAVA